MKCNEFFLLESECSVEGLMMIMRPSTEHSDSSFGWRVRATTIYHEIVSAADNTLLHSPRHIALGVAVGYETLPPIGWHHLFMMVGLDTG